MCVIRFLQSLVLEPIDFEIITKALLKNCRSEVQTNLRKAQFWQITGGKEKATFEKECLKKSLENTVKSWRRYKRKRGR